ncbi:unnamed protein product, partial [Didymodactylos carnosus]
MIHVSQIATPIDILIDREFLALPFHVAPKLFEQMYSIHDSIRGKTLPLLYALLPNKTQGTDEELFKIVDQYIQHKPKYVTIDFEKAAENALATVFPQCDIFSCFFHFKQCELRLRKEFLENADSRHTMKNLVALAFVPQQNVIQEFYSNKRKCARRIR